MTVMTNVRGDRPDCRMTDSGLTLTPVSVESQCLPLVAVPVPLLGLWRIRREVEQVVKVNSSNIHTWLFYQLPALKCVQELICHLHKCVTINTKDNYPLTEAQPDVIFQFSPQNSLVTRVMIPSSPLYLLRLTAGGTGAPRYTTGLCVITPTHTSTSCSSVFYCALCSLPNECIFNPEHS